ncbi:MAG: sodium:proton antiporter [Chloroflexi bacterium]|nr:sodium:proton antiporter [Chloroflexota bacterium]MCY3583611.1 sodium:proton antiporter [Chloroflexota bacterium]MCY3715745.1 sodium:proton antiporter [Chloroflexota bacterium]MDE2651264.1 sodium:proton antiporter [Chloroflexota bacterium]MXV92433.1 cation:proton antiporter [Chloroflexota bacterium]
MTEFMFALAIGILFGIGVFQLLRRDLIKAAIGFAILFSAINLFFVAAGAFEGEAPPYLSNVLAGRATSDPLVQALILTAIVVSFGSFSLVLGIVNIISKRYDTVDSNDVTNLKH